MKKLFRLLSLMAILFGLVLFPMKPLYAEASPRRADFGDFSGDSDFGGGGGWDSGGSDWDSGGSWDSDSGSYSSGSGSGSGSDMEAVITIIVIIIIIIASTSSRKKNTSTNTQTYQPQETKSLRRIEEYSETDPSFNAEQFRDKVSNLYVQFQNAWQNKDISPLRPYLTDTYFAQMDNQLNRYRQNHQTNMVERIAVLSTQLMGWRQESGLDEMVIKLDTRIVDYVIDDNTGSVVRGSKTAEKFMTYEWTLVRTTGVTTSRSTGTTGQTCPYCGANININQTTVCEYCGSVITTDKFDWAVSNIRALSQRTRQ